MSKSVNKVIIVGNLARDPDVRTTNSGKQVATVDIITNDGYGEHERTNSHRCTVWGKSAEYAGKYIKKGHQVYVEGSYEDKVYEKDGVKKYSKEVNVFDIKHLTTKAAGGAAVEPSLDNVPF